MEYGVFPTRKFQAVLAGYVEARLHNDLRVKNTDEFTPEALEVRELEQKLVGHLAIPYYIVMDPSNEKVLLTHELRLVDQEEKLLEFLEEGRALLDR